MNYRPWYNENVDYQTNAKSYMDYLGRVNKFMKVLMEDYEVFQELILEEFKQFSLDNTQTIEEFQERLDDIKQEMIDFFVEWLEDGTLEQIINHDVLGNKADKSFVDSEIERLDQTDEDLTTHVDSEIERLDQTDENNYTLLQNYDFKLTQDLLNRSVNVLNPPENLNSAIGDGVTDDTQAILAIINYCETNEKSILFPAGYEFLINQPLHFNGKNNIYMIGLVSYDGTHDQTVLTIGDGTQINFGEYVINVESKQQSNWANENYIGVKLVNINTTKIHLQRVIGFTIGIVLYGYGRGICYNNIFLDRIGNHKINLKITNSGSGWANENIFFGGRFYTNSDVNQNLDRYGVQITSENDYLQNNNTFYKPSFELGVGKQSRVESIPVLMESGTLNIFKDVRHESNGDQFARVLDYSTANEFEIGYGNANTFIEDTSFYPTTSLVNRRSIHKHFTTHVFNSGNLAEKSTPYEESTTNNTIDDVAFYDGSGELFRRAPYEIENGYIRLGAWSVGIDLYLSDWTRKILILKNTVGNNNGRVGVICFDDNGNRIGDIDGRRAVHGMQGRNITHTNMKGENYYRTGTDYTGQTFIHFRDDVKKVRILLERGGDEWLDIRSFSIFTESGGIATPAITN